MANSLSYCLCCNKPLKGRADKKYCSDTCRNQFFNKQKELERAEIRTIDLVLKKNRRILRDLLGDHTSINISEKDLLVKGFVFLYYTHHLTTKMEQREYVFCYDYGYRQMENGWYKVVKSFK